MLLIIWGLDISIQRFISKTYIQSSDQCMLALHVWAKRMQSSRTIGILQLQKSKQIINYSAYFPLSLLDIVEKHQYVLKDHFPD